MQSIHSGLQPWDGTNRHKEAGGPLHTNKQLARCTRRDVQVQGGRSRVRPESWRARGGVTKRQHSLREGDLGSGRVHDSLFVAHKETGEPRGTSHVNHQPQFKTSGPPQEFASRTRTGVNTLSSTVQPTTSTLTASVTTVVRLA